MQYVWGKRACSCQVAIAPMIEDRMRRAGLVRNDLSGLVYQGSWSSAAASKGTHSGGGAWDLYWSLCTNTAVRIMRESGVAYWPRPGMAPRHGHGVLIGCPHLHSSAKAQVRQYRNGTNGLANYGHDPYPRPGVVTWRAALAAWEAEKPVDPIIGDPARGSLLPA